MTKTWTVLLASVGILAVSPQSAWAGENATLDRCFQAALGRAETVNVQDELVHQAEEHYTQARSQILPSVAGVGTYSIQQPTPNRTSNQPMAKITATQPLFRGLRDFAALRQTTGLIKAAQLDRKAAVVQLYKDVVQIFYGILSLEKDLLNIQTELGLYEKRIAEISKFEKIGRSKPSDRLTAETAQAVLRAEGKQLSGQILANREVLFVLTGLPADTALNGDSQQQVVAQSLADDLKQISARPEVAAANMRVDAAAEAVQIARGSHYPSVDLSGNYYLVRESDLKNVTWDVQLGLTVPIYSGGLVASQVSEAVSKKQQAIDTTEQTRRTAEQEIRSTHIAVVSDQAQIVELESATKLAETNFNQQQRDFRLGLETNIDVLSALAQFQESQRALDRTRFSLMIDRERYETAAGRKPQKISL